MNYRGDDVEAFEGWITRWGGAVFGFVILPLLVALFVGGMIFADDSKAPASAVAIPVEQAKELREALGVAQYVSGVVNFLQGEVGQTESGKETIRVIQIRANGLGSAYVAKLREVQGDLVAAKYPGNWKEWNPSPDGSTLVPPKPKP